MRGRAYSKKPRTQANNVNARARAFKNIANSKKQNQCEGARIQTIRELTQTRSMRGRKKQSRELKQTMSMPRPTHLTKPRTQANNVIVRARAFNKNRELKQTRSMRGRAHSNKLRTQSNNVNARARVFKETVNASKQRQCAGARIQKQREFTETKSM